MVGVVRCMHGAITWYSREPPSKYFYIFACVMYSSGIVCLASGGDLAVAAALEQIFTATAQIPRPPALVIGCCGMGSQAVAGLLDEVPNYLCAHRNRSHSAGHKHVCVWVEVHLTCLVC